MTTKTGKCLLSKEVTREILSRLRVKTLMRFSCVCKYWYFLVRNSSFINKHLHNPNNYSRLLLLHQNYKIEKPVYTLFPDETLSSVPHTFENIHDLETPLTPSAVLGPFDGIVCLFYHSRPPRMALWNPATKEFISLLVQNPNYPSHFDDFRHSLGFGLDPITNDYKLVWMRHYWNNETDRSYIPIVVSVYTLGIDSWRHFEFVTNESYSVENSLCNTYKNGYYYWVCQTDKYTLLSFDMRTDNFKEDIPSPPSPSNYTLVAALTMYNDNIAMFLYHYGDEIVEHYIYTYVMEKEGYWTKHVSIGPLFRIDWPYRPLGIWRNGDIFIESADTQDLLLYEQITKELKNLGPRGEDFCLQTLLYKESLVSLKGGKESVERDTFLERVQYFFTYPPWKY